jgi:hypothetical protein
MPLLCGSQLIHNFGDMTLKLTSGMPTHALVRIRFASFFKKLSFNQYLSYVLTAYN